MTFGLALGGNVPALINNADLTDMNTLRVPAKAQYLARVTSIEELQALLKWRQLHGRDSGTPLPILVLGGGSNIVLTEDFCGLVIEMAIHGREEQQENEQHIWVKVGAGENWHNWVSHCMSFHYWGLENLALIPGTVGAAPIQNIGAYGVELKDCFEELTAVEINSGLPVTFDADACHFAYRDSVFKQRLQDAYIITSVTFRLNTQACSNIGYPALRQYFEANNIDQPTPQQVFEAVCAIRASKLPDPTTIPNVGSFFKNPLVDRSQFASLQQTYPDIVGYPQSMPLEGSSEPAVKLAAGWLIERAGWKGRHIDGVGVHDKQALVLVNPGHEPGAKILQLARAIQADIRAQFGVALDIEPRVYSTHFD